MDLKGSAATIFPVWESAPETAREKTLANFDLKRLPSKVGRQLKVLLDGSFLDRKENLLLFGNPGAGKSHLLCALAQERKENLLLRNGRRKKPSAMSNTCWSWPNGSATADDTTASRSCSASRGCRIGFRSSRNNTASPLPSSSQQL
jgi:IstB-like ATP binding protein